jgi:5'-nucleotidase
VADKKQILLTNDDGIRSPGLWAAAEALEPLGYVTVAAPAQQWSGAGRSMPADSTGRIHREQVRVNNREWTVYAVEGTPAQVVQHALLEIMPAHPALIVAGINYGENVGSGVTISGTVGAVLEGASFGLPGLAVSLETDAKYHRSHSTDVEFSAAAHFTQKFARLLLATRRPPDLDLLKVDVPNAATPATPWRITRVSRTRYFLPTKPARTDLAEPGRVGYQAQAEPGRIEPDSDVRAIVDGVVSVTPISLDLTSRVDLQELARLLEEHESEA